jgi:hypothetical protein
MLTSTQKMVRAVVAITLITGSFSPARSQFQWTCRYPSWINNGAAWEGTHNVKYVSYIPADHIMGPVANPCFNVPAGFVQKIYKGDPNAIIFGYPPQSWRTSSIFSFNITNSLQGPFWKDPMETRTMVMGHR